MDIYVYRQSWDEGKHVVHRKGDNFKCPAVNLEQAMTFCKLLAPEGLNNRLILNSLPNNTGTEPAIPLLPQETEQLETFCSRLPAFAKKEDQGLLLRSGLKIHLFKSNRVPFIAYREGDSYCTNAHSLIQLLPLLMRLAPVLLPNRLYTHELPESMKTPSWELLDLPDANHIHGICERLKNFKSE